MNRLDEAEAVLRQAEAGKLDSEQLLATWYNLAVLRGDTAAMARVLSTAGRNPDPARRGLGWQINFERAHGRFEAARELNLEILPPPERRRAKRLGLDTNMGEFEAEVGEYERAHANAVRALRQDLEEGGCVAEAMTFALTGDVDRAERMIAELNRRRPVGTIVQRYQLPSIRAAMALQRRDPRRAIELLQPAASPMDLGADGGLVPAYYRGVAYLTLHDGKAAAAEFQKFIDHPGIVVISLYSS